MFDDLNNLKFFVGPRDLGADDDLEGVIVDFLDGARETLNIAVQELESVPITDALVRARQRGVRVRIVLEGDYLIESPARPNPGIAGGGKEPNRELLNRLWRAGIDARTDYNPKIFHQKFVVRDIDGGSRRAVLTGSTNFTPTGTHSNLNHLVTIRSKPVADAYQEEFDEIWNGTFGQVRLRHDPKPLERAVSGVRVKILFAPDHAPEMEIMKQMLKAQERIEFAIFTFSQSSGIDDTMMALVRSGIAVRGVFDALQGGQQWAATEPLRQAGADVSVARNFNVTVDGEQRRLGKLHHKLMVIDRQVVIGGSFNYTGPANRLNDENIFVIGDLEEDDPDSRQRQAALATYAAGEIDRIIRTHVP